MTGNDGREVVEAMVPQAELDCLCPPFGVIERQLHLGMLGRAMVIAARRTQGGQAPNWRRRPAVLDQLRGWKRQPLARKKPNSRDVSHGHVKAAA